jgi:hypothetical protein
MSHVLSQMNPFNTISSYIFKPYFNIVTDFPILQIDGTTQRLGKRLLPPQRIATDEINVLPQNESTSPWRRIPLTVGHLLDNQIVAMET